MIKKSFVFSLEYEFIADDEKDALEQFQDMLHDEDWGDAVLDAERWSVTEEEVDVSE